MHIPWTIISTRTALKNALDNSSCQKSYFICQPEVECLVFSMMILPLLACLWLILKTHCHDLKHTRAYLSIMGRRAKKAPRIAQDREGKIREYHKEWIQKKRRGKERKNSRTQIYMFLSY